jgi:hypothetical protein
MATVKDYSQRLDMEKSFLRCLLFHHAAVSKGSARGEIVLPFECLGQRGVAAAQLLQVIGGSGRVRQSADNVGENKPPLLIVKDPAHRPLFE